MLTKTNPLSDSTSLTTNLTQSTATTAGSLTADTNLQLLNRSSTAGITVAASDLGVTVTGNGLKGEYFSDRTFSNMKLERIDSTVNFDWANGSPDASIGVDNFSARWTGQVQPEYSETYTFSTLSDDGVRLWVNGQKLIDNWTDHASTEDNGSIALTAGQKYDIKLEYYETSGGAVSNLQWSSPHQTKEIILQSQLYASTVPLPALNVNDQPVIMVPDSQSATQSVNLPISGISISDLDAGDGELTVTLSAAHGALTVDDDVNGGVPMTKISNNGTGSVILIGTLLQINATLANPNGLIYRSEAGFQGTDRISITANDNGNTGSGGAQTDSQALSITVAGAGSNTGGSGGGSSSYPNAKSPLGMNLNEVVDYGTQLPFVDVFKTSRPWVSQKDGAAWGQGGQLNLTAEGWIASLQPGQSATTTVLGNGGHYPEGQYVLLYDGQGKLEVGGGKVVSQTPGRMVINVLKSSNGVGFTLRETNPSNPLRNIRFLMPGTENTYQTQPFYKGFLDRLANFKVLRFMDWEKTNGSPLKNWSDRNTPNSASQQSDKGVALEHMIQLANTLHTDPWFTIPHQASDDYVRQFATMVRDRLDPSLKVHIEYSNEVWNGAFPQSNYARQKGLALGLSSADWEAGQRYYSQRSVEVFKIFEQVFGGTSRLDRVLAWQGTNAYSGEDVVKWKNAYQQADEYAIAPYFYGGYNDLINPANVDNTLKLSQDQIIDKMLVDIRTDVKQAEVNSYNLANKYGLGLVAYEGGPHLVSYQMGGKSAQVTQLFSNVNRNPRMRDVYKEYLNQWKQVGGGLFNQFNDVGQYSQYGMWGSLEYQDQDINTAPKYLGLIDFIKANPTS